MKKRIYLWIIAVMLILLTACGPGQKEESEMPGEHTVSESGPGTEETESGTGAEQDISEVEAGADGTESGTKGSTENAASADHEYEKAEVIYGEPTYGLSFRRDMDKTKTEYASYFFEPSIDRQERNACIEATDRMLSCIGAALSDIEVAVFTQETYDGVSISGNRLYLSSQPWDSVDYLAKVLLAGCGEWGNYGLAYGYADYLCQKAGMGTEETGSDGQEVHSFRAMSDPNLYDLNLLCFDERFSSPEDVEASKNNARLFVENYLSSHSEAEFLELLSASGTEEGVAQVNKTLETFYAEKGVECSLTEIRYQCGGAAFDYGVACKYANFYIAKGWKDTAWQRNPRISENFFRENYREIRAFFECNERQMQEYQNFFSFDSYSNDLTVILANASFSYSRADIHEIYLISVESLMHEYIHFLMAGRCDQKSLWKLEGATCYFSYKYDAYSYDSLNIDWNNDSRIWTQEYIDSIGRPIDVTKDFRKFEDIYVHAIGITSPDHSYRAGSSFVGYLVEQYGEKAVIAYICSDDTYSEEWGKSYEELVQDWNRYIEENYSQYSINAGQ